MGVISDPANIALNNRHAVKQLDACRFLIISPEVGVLLRPDQLGCQYPYFVYPLV